MYDCSEGHIVTLDSYACCVCGINTKEGGAMSIYYSPEDHSLKLFGELDEPNLSYEFHMLVVWVSHDGRLWYAEDSGCSCPSPFEDFHSVDDLIEITYDSLDQFWTVVNDFVSYSTEGDLACEKTQLLSRVTSALPPLDVSGTITGLQRIARDLAS
jgi:hypothetical protein